MLKIEVDNDVQPDSNCDDGILLFGSYDWTKREMSRFDDTEMI